MTEGRPALEDEVFAARRRMLAQGPTPLYATADGLLARVGRHRIAVPLESTRQVAAPAPLTLVPNAGHVLLGIRMIRGEPLAVADTAALLGTGSLHDPSAAWVVVLEDAAPVGLLVDAVTGVAALPTERRTVPSAIPDSCAHLLAAVSGDGTLTLDPRALLGDPRLTLGRSADDMETETL